MFFSQVKTLRKGRSGTQSQKETYLKFNQDERKFKILFLITYPRNGNLHCCFKLLLSFCSSLFAPFELLQLTLDLFSQNRKGTPWSSFSKVAVTHSASVHNSQGRPTGRGRGLEWDQLEIGYQTSTLLKLHLHFSFKELLRGSIMLDPSLQLDCLTPTIPCPQTFFSSLSPFFSPTNSFSSLQGKVENSRTLLCKANCPFFVSTSPSLAKSQDLAMHIQVRSFLNKRAFPSSFYI